VVDLVDLIPICEKAASVGAKAIARLRKRRLSSEEEQLLVAAAADGKFFLLTGEQIHGALVRAGGNISEGTLHPGTPRTTLPIAMPHRPRLNAFRTSSGTFGSALRPESSTDTLQHVMVRGLECRRIFQDDADRADFVGRLEALVPATGLRVYAWALLPNHAHLLVRNSGDTLSNW